VVIVEGGRARTQDESTTWVTLGRSGELTCNLNRGIWLYLK